MLGIVCAMEPVVALVCVCYVVEVNGVGDGKTEASVGVPLKIPGLERKRARAPVRFACSSCRA